MSDIVSLYFILFIGLPLAEPYYFSRKGYGKNVEGNFDFPKIEERQYNRMHDNPENMNERKKVNMRGLDGFTNVPDNIIAKEDNMKRSKRIARDTRLDLEDSKIPESLLRFLKGEEEPDQVFEEVRENILEINQTGIPRIKGFLNFTEQFVQMLNKLPFANGRFSNFKSKFQNLTSPFMILIGKFPNFNMSSIRPNQPIMPVMPGAQPTIPSQPVIPGQPTQTIPGVVQPATPGQQDQAISLPGQTEGTSQPTQPPVQQPSVPAQPPAQQPTVPAQQPSVPAQPPVQQPSVPAQPPVQQPSVPAQPSEQQPTVPAQPPVQQPSVPAQPPVQQPSVPAQPPVQQPSVPVQPPGQQPSVPEQPPIQEPATAPVQLPTVRINPLNNSNEQSNQQSNESTNPFNNFSQIFENQISNITGFFPNITDISSSFPFFGGNRNGNSDSTANDQIQNKKNSFIIT